METFKLFMAAGDYFHPKLQFWLYWMQGILFLAPILLIYFKAARIQVLVMLVTLGLALLIFWYDGYSITKLLSASHVVWLISLFYLYEAVKSDRWIIYRVWAGLAIATILISLVFDVKEVAEYLMGDHASILVGVPADSPLYRP